MNSRMNLLAGAIALAALLAACGGGPSSGTAQGTSGTSLALAGGGDSAGTGAGDGSGTGSGTGTGSGAGGDTGGTGGTGGTGTGDAGGSGTTPPTDPVGDAVSDSHSDSDDQFNADLQAKLDELASQGTLCGDNGAKQILGMKISSISHFVDNVASIVTAAIQAGQPVDKPALIDLLNQYRAEDKAWLANPEELLALCGWSLEEFQATKAQNSQSIDSLYDGLISLIQSL